MVDGLRKDRVKHWTCACSGSTRLRASPRYANQDRACRPQVIERQDPDGGEMLSEQEAYV
jgi:hypothetical protein